MTIVEAPKVGLASCLVIVVVVVVVFRFRQGSCMCVCVHANLTWPCCCFRRFKAPSMLSYITREICTYTLHTGEYSSTLNMLASLLLSLRYRKQLEGSHNFSFNSRRVEMQLASKTHKHTASDRER